MIKKHWRWLAALAAALVAGAVGWTLTHPQEGSLGIMYRVTGGKAEMTLLGSIHVGNRAMYPFGQAITDAMAQADTFVYECDTTDADVVAALQARMRLADGQTLRDVLDDALYQELMEVCAQLRLTPETIDTLKPWAVINTLATYATAAQLGTANINQALSLGVEKQVQALEKRAGKPAVYLETAEEQTDVLEGFSDALQHYLLQGECDEILHPQTVKNMDATIAQWPEWWRTGNAQAFADNYLDTYLEPGHEAECLEYHTQLVVNRNVRMADRLDEMLQSGGSYFVTVGLLHLTLPEGSIVSLLREKGYTVEAVGQP